MNELDSISNTITKLAHIVGHYVFLCFSLLYSMICCVFCSYPILAKFAKDIKFNGN